jgi:MFS family permease
MDIQSTEAVGGSARSPTDTTRSEQDDGPVSSQRGWMAVTIFLILYALGFLDRQVLSLMVEPIREDLGATDFQISILSGVAFVLFYTICAVPIGWAVDRFSRRWIIFGGVMTWSFCASACGLATTYWQLLFCRFGVGAGEAALGPGAYSMLSDLFRKDRLAGAMAVFSTGATIGGALSFVLGGAIIGLTSGSGNHVIPLIGEVKPWQLVFLISGAPGFILAFTVFLVKEPRRRGLSIAAKKAPPPLSALFPFMRSNARFYAAHFAGFGLFNLMSAGALVWAPTYLIREFHWPVSQVGLVLGLGNLIFCTGGMLFSGYFADRLFQRGMTDAHLRYYAVLVWVAGLAGLGAMLVSNVTLVLAGLAILFFIAPFIAVAATALQITTPNEYRGQVSAMFLMVYNIVGFGIGPSIIAAISDFGLGGTASIGHGIAITFAIFTPLSGAAFLYGLRPMREAVAKADAIAASGGIDGN